MGVIANYPIALAPGMGVNAFFTFTICMKYGYSWQAALAAVFMAGIVFLVISVTGIRKMIINSIPKDLKLAIGAGIGFFIAFIGLKNAGIIVDNPATLVGLGNFKDPVVLLAVFGLLMTIILFLLRVNGAVFFGIVITAIAGVILRAIGVEGICLPMPSAPTGVVSVDFDFSLFGAFAGGFAELFSKPNAIVIIFSLLFVDFFDTAGTLVAIGNSIGLVKENGEMENIEKALLVDAVGTVGGSMMGTSTITSFIESGSGVSAGGRTGLTAVTTGVCFLLSIFFFPLLAVITPTVTAPALIIVGVLMAKQMADIHWDDLAINFSAFITIIIMTLTYSISDGIAFGFLAYTVAYIASGRFKEVKPIIYLLDLIFILYLMI